MQITESICDVSSSPIESLCRDAFFLTLPGSIPIAITNLNSLKSSLSIEELIWIQPAGVRFHFAVEV